MSHRQNQLLMLGTKMLVIVVFGEPYRFSVLLFLFNSTRNNANMQRKWLHGFRISKLLGMD